MLFPLGLYGAVVLALLVAELREDRRAQYLFKPLAALGFILLALYCGALETTYGQIILAGLVACALGDSLLLSRDKPKLFLLGMAAFALGHIIFTFGFLETPLVLEPVQNKKPPVFSMLLLGVTGAAYLIPKVGKSDRIPAMLYSVIILTMMGAAGLTWNVTIIVGAALFAVSDFFVGHDRFVKYNPLHALAITPLYFGAQALFALSVQV